VRAPRAAAAEGAPAARGLPAAQAALASGDSYRTTLVPEPRSNAIIVRAANSARLSLAKTLIEQLDQPPHQRADGGTGNIHVVYLKNADATKLAVTLRAALAALPGQQASAAGGGAGASGGSTAASSGTPASASTGSSNGNSLTTGPSINAAAGNQPSTGGQIQADPATNSLIISAPEPVYRELRAVIDKLDQRRAQVFVESLIAEVNMSKAADLGVQWQMFGQNGSNVGVIGTNFSTGSSTNIFDIATAVLGYRAGGGVESLASARPSTGFNFALGTRALGILANFLQSTGTGNVLSAPTLLTLDNEEAKIIIGKNVPIVTGSFAAGTTGAAVNPFQTYDRQDVGLTLRVRPQISEDGTIKMVLYQEVSSVDPATANNQSGPTTSKRAIESSVLIDDGAIVVLGGLMEDTYGSSEDKVPVLGDVPIIGNLFKSQNRNITKTNLMVFLRPVIVRDAASTENYSLDRYDMMRAAQQASQPRPSSVLQVNEAPLIPPVVPVNPDAWSRPAPPPPLIRPVAPPSAQPAAGESNYYGEPIRQN
ncbi:MAG: type II secretion system secretin GspD, partial [Pseudomonadota bacterium]|nr:type II secretion system secretin GspD [Pseudomonadota bacterium]